MRFEDAMTELRNGKRVKRKVWTRSYMFLGKSVDEEQHFKETLYLGNLGSRKVYPVRNLATGCILGDDWTVVTEE